MSKAKAAVIAAAVGVLVFVILIYVVSMISTVRNCSKSGGVAVAAVFNAVHPVVCVERHK